MFSNLINNSVTIFLSFIATIFLVIAYRSWNGSVKIIKNGVHTEGVVIGMERRKTKGGKSNTQAPVVQFKTQNGEVISYYSTTYTSPSSYYEGQVVPIWYMPDNPQEATLKGADMYLLPLVFMGFGIVATLIALPMLFKLFARLIYQ